MFTDNRELYIAHCDDGNLCIDGRMANRLSLIHI